MMECFAKSGQGASHVKTNKPCQDASGCFPHETYHLAVVADGHGGEEYFRSDRGSRFAVDVTHSIIGSFVKEHTGVITDTDVKNIEKNIIEQWRRKVLNDIKAQPWTTEELKYNPSSEDTFNIYGTTLLAAAITNQGWFVIQIGDGACVVIDEQGSRLAVADDASQGLGSTHSLCEENALTHFRHAIGTGVLLGVTVATDGVTDAVPQNNYLFNFTINILKAFVENSDEAKKELESALPTLSQTGSQDDVSIACIFNVDAARPRLKRIIDISKMCLKATTQEKEMSDLKKKVDVSVKEKNELTGKNSDLLRKVERLEHSVQEEKNKCRQAETDLGSLKKRYEEQERELKKERSTNRSNESDKDSLKRDLYAKNKEIQDLNNKIKKNEKERDDALNKNDTELDNLQKEFNAVQEENASLKKQLEQRAKPVGMVPPVEPGTPKASDGVKSQAGVDQQKKIDDLQKEDASSKKRLEQRVKSEEMASPGSEPSTSKTSDEGKSQASIDQQKNMSEPESNTQKVDAKKDTGKKSFADNDEKKKTHPILANAGWGVAAVLFLMWVATLLLR